MGRMWVVSGLALALGACAGSTIPVAVLTSKGVTLRGSVTGSLFNASFQVANGKQTCSGFYPPAGEAKIVTVTLKCSDGHTGIALVSRQDAFNGGGTVRFSDGTEGTFVFGDGASRV